MILLTIRNFTTLLIIGEIATNQSKTNEHGIAHRRGFTTHTIQPIPDLRSGLNSPPSSAGSTSGRPPFQGQYQKNQKFDTKNSSSKKVVSKLFCSFFLTSFVIRSLIFFSLLFHYSLYISFDSHM